VPNAAVSVAGGVLFLIAQGLLFRFVDHLPAAVGVVISAFIAVTIPSILTRRVQPSAIGVAIAAVILLPGIAPSVASTSLMATIGALALISIGQNIVTGYTGQLSVGQGAMAGIGAYCVAILINRFEWPWWLALAASPFAASFVGVIVGIWALRLRGMYLAMVTLAMVVALPTVAKVSPVSEWTNGVQGILLVAPTPPEWLNGLDTSAYLYVLTLGVLGAMVYLAARLMSSRHGLALRALRESELAAQISGVSLLRYKIWAFVVASAYAGLGGGLLALIVGIVTPDAYTVMFSIDFLVMVVIGGLGSIVGSIVGAAIVWELRVRVSTITLSLLGIKVELLPWTLYGLAVIAIMMFMPEGVVGLVGAMMRRVSERKAGSFAGVAAPAGTKDRQT
jgi:branched-chain amino acid transport system permease protein